MVPTTGLAWAVAMISALGMSLAGFSLKSTKRLVVTESDTVSGLKTTLMVQLSPAASVVVQALVTVSSIARGAASALIVMPVAAEPPLFVTV